jgi:hypothetical protein
MAPNGHSNVVPAHTAGSRERKTASVSPRAGQVPVVARGKQPQPHVVKKPVSSAVHPSSCSARHWLTSFEK